MNMTLQRRKSFKPNDIIHDQFIILGKLDNQKHSSKLFKGILFLLVFPLNSSGFDKISRNFVVLKIVISFHQVYVLIQ